MIQADVQHQPRPEDLIKLFEALNGARLKGWWQGFWAGSLGTLSAVALMVLIYMAWR